MLSGKKYPQTLRFKEITSEGWVRFNLASDDMLSNPTAFLLQSKNGILGFYLTKGEMISSEGVTFLVTYRVSIDGLVEAWFLSMDT